MAKAELGTKRICPQTGRKFYDLGKSPVISPYTGEIVPIAPLPQSRSRGVPAAAAAAAPVAAEVETPEAAEVELVSLEDADAESEGGKKATSDVDAEDDVEAADDDAAEDDSTFLETDEDEGDNVSDIVGGEREDEEDT